ncbi:DnaJ domain,Chaperone DnaJ, C-terminal,HSP40/DnaJ peptide-binding [Cinara cedri]|uniref:DnaJ domain,Chaperone DnaJ, C-terminal,HSP40/DnaJ peptide-binding n=1 Tax=Cinara cedri TaxID=506608 RepID=A0A5E4MZT7_9HEMI|nr:DnaJ domain,Chaperone DnaJ, C-terminal,HSP40/DnaJ peptide-binding [Cinara cedri]
MMSINYYHVLGLKRTCSKFDVIKAFQEIVHKFGMDEKLNDEDNERRLIAFEAYDVISNPFWRELYDRYGDIAIKMGVFVDSTSKHKQEMKQYSYHGDIFLTYKYIVYHISSHLYYFFFLLRSVYGSTNPYAHIMAMLSHTCPPIDLDKPIVKKIPVYLTLNEIFFGTLKKINVPDSDGTQRIVNVKISKGLPVNSEIVKDFPDGRSVVFITYDLPHKQFVRNGRNLITTYIVTIKEMICGVRCVVKTLDNKRLTVNITQVITPTYEKTIRNEGMPAFHQENNSDGDNKRGDLILKFKITMPRYFVLNNDDELRKALSETCY